MDPNKCQAYKKCGTQCNSKFKEGSQYCGTHLKSIEKNGPHFFAREQLHIRHSNELTEFNRSYTEQFNQRELTEEQRDTLSDQREIARTALEVRHTGERRNLVRLQQQEIQRLGYDPDIIAQNRRRVVFFTATVRVYEERLHPTRITNNVIIDEIRQLRQTITHYGREMNRDENQNDPAFRESVTRLIVMCGMYLETWMNRARERNLDPNAVVQNRDRIHERQLERISHDNQNVHTTQVVEHVKSNIKYLFDNIKVPLEHQWNVIFASHTYLEIVFELKLSMKVARHFSQMYLCDDSIYDYEKGIYGKVVDRVWQFICKSPHKSDLMKILKSELNDNVGMCPQGNLSRIVNVLMGYLDGLKQEETSSEILGREFPKLMNIEDIDDRIARGRQLLATNNVPESNWNEWLEPLL